MCSINNTTDELAVCPLPILLPLYFDNGGPIEGLLGLEFPRLLVLYYAEGIPVAFVSGKTSLVFRGNDAWFVYRSLSNKHRTYITRHASLWLGRGWVNGLVATTADKFIDKLSKALSNLNIDFGRSMGKTTSAVVKPEERHAFRKILI